MTFLLLAMMPAARASATELAFWGLEADDGGFVDVYTGSDVPQWQWGVVVGGPGSSFDATRAWATGLTSDYLSDSTNCLEIPLPSLASAARPVLQLHHWHAFGAGDYGRVVVDPGGGFAPVEPVYGYPAGSEWSGASDGWELVSVDLTGYGAAPRVCLQFVADDDSVVAAGWFVDDVGLYDGDVVPPRILAVSTLGDTENLAGPYVVDATVVDDAGTPTATLHWSTDDGGGAVPMTDDGGGVYSAGIPGQAPDTVVTWWVEASDGDNDARIPSAGGESFRVYLPAPTGLTGPAGRYVGKEATLEWLPPVSAHTVQGYVVERDGVEVVTCDTPEADVPLTGGSDTFVVRAVYGEGTGDASEPFTVDAVVPAVAGLDPAEGYPGDQLRLALTGEYLLLVEGDVRVTFDANVDVTDVTVRDVDLAWVEVDVAADAPPGAVGVEVRSAAGDVRLEGAFTVLDGADRPRLLSVEPDSVRQGESTTLTVGYVGDLAGEPSVDLGEGIVVEAVEVDGDTVRVDVAVANNAPLGERAVTLDDGVRLYGGVAFEVKDVLVTTQGPCGCQAGGGGASGAALALAGLLARRRRR